LIFIIISESRGGVGRRGTLEINRSRKVGACHTAPVLARAHGAVAGSVAETAAVHIFNRCTALPQQSFPQQGPGLPPLFVLYNSVIKI